MMMRSCGLEEGEPRSVGGDQAGETYKFVWLAGLAGPAHHSFVGSRRNFDSSISELCSDTPVLRVCCHAHHSLWWCLCFSYEGRNFYGRWTDREDCIRVQRVFSIEMLKVTRVERESDELTNDDDVKYLVTKFEYFIKTKTRSKVKWLIVGFVATLSYPSITFSSILCWWICK